MLLLIKKMVISKCKICLKEQKDGIRQIIKEALYGFKQKERIRCLEHRLKTDEKTNPNFCREYDCENIGIYGYDTEDNKNTSRKGNRFWYCLDHKKENMIKLNKYICKINDCIKKASYKENNLKVLCYEHKTEDSISSDKRICKGKNEDGSICKSRATYGKIKGKPIFCKNHNNEEYINVVSKLCKELGCMKQAHYGKLNTRTRIFCGDHAPDEYINLSFRKCGNLKCKIIANYNFPGKGTGKFCTTHKEEGMINLYNDICKKIGCGKTAKYGYLKDMKRLYCFEHKSDDMVDIYRYNCINDDCKLTATHGLLFQKKTHCARHALRNEYKYNNPICKCGKKAYYAKNNNYPIKCENCKTDEFINVIEKSCIKCNLVYFIKNTSDLCDYCFGYEKEIKRGFKERKIKQLLDENNIIYISHDKIPEGSCFKYRPDFIMDQNDRIVIIEVDEYQHESYDKNCEETRMFHIYEDFGGLPIIFIRYNPDNHKINSENPSFQKKFRYKLLLETFNKCKDMELKYLLTVIYLYYDDCPGPIEKYIDIDAIFNKFYIEKEKSNIFNNTEKEEPDNIIRNIGKEEID